MVDSVFDCRQGTDNALIVGDMLIRVERDVEVDLFGFLRSATYTPETPHESYKLTRISTRLPLRSTSWIESLFERDMMQLRVAKVLYECWRDVIVGRSKKWSGCWELFVSNDLHSAQLLLAGEQPLYISMSSPRKAPRGWREFAVTQAGPALCRNRNIPHLGTCSWRMNAKSSSASVFHGLIDTGTAEHVMDLLET